MEPDTFHQIFRQYGPFLWRTFRSLGISAADADDLSQEAMLVVFRRLEEFDGRSLSGWLYGICLRIAAKHRTRLKRRREVNGVPEQSEPPTQHEAVEGQQVQSQLMEILEKLPEAKRQAFVLYEIEQLSLAQVAEAMDCSVKTAYWRLDSARKTVRKAFARLAPEFEVQG